VGGRGRASHWIPFFKRVREIAKSDNKLRRICPQHQTTERDHNNIRVPFTPINTAARKAHGDYKPVQDNYVDYE
jgi:hypothetical protein